MISRGRPLTLATRQCLLLYPDLGVPRVNGTSSRPAYAESPRVGYPEKTLIYAGQVKGRPRPNRGCQLVPKAEEEINRAEENAACTSRTAPCRKPSFDVTDADGLEGYV